MISSQKVANELDHTVKEYKACNCPYPFLFFLTFALLLLPFRTIDQCHRHRICCHNAIMQSALGSAAYTITSATYDKGVALMQKLLAKPQKPKAGQTDRPTQ